MTDPDTFIEWEYALTLDGPDNPRLDVFGCLGGSCEAARVNFEWGAALTEAEFHEQINIAKHKIARELLSR